MPAKTRRKIAQRLAQAEQLGQDEDGMLADTEDEDEDDADAKIGAQISVTGATTTDQRQVHAEFDVGDAEALAAKYLALDTAAQERFRKKCGLSVI